VTIGRSSLRVDAVAKVTGAARYPADLPAGDALWAMVVFTNRPHARLLMFDARPAMAVPGVVEVVTAADVPVNEYGLTEHDQPVLVGVEHTGRARVECDVSRWEADHLAVVIGETPEAARRGADALVAEWEDLPVVADIAAALSPGAPLLHPEVADTNAYHHYRIRKGDMEAGWAAAGVVVEGTYRVPHQEHAYLQPEAALAYLDGEDRITVEIAGQWTMEDVEQIAHALDLAPDRIRVVYPAIGGAFGGREDMSLQIVMALAVAKLARRGIRRPVRARWSREESIVGHHKRHRGEITARLGATRDGRITAVEVDAVLDAGAYNYTTNKVLGNLHLMVAGPYDVPNARIDSIGVYTNSVPGGAFRGFGAPQGAFVAESQMNKLAEALGMDPVELRMRNALRDGSIGITQVEMPLGVSIAEVIEACAAAAATPAEHRRELAAFASLPPRADRVRSGRGFACSYKNVGFSFGFPERCEAKIVLHGEDSIEWVDLYHGAAEVGQGTHTALTQMAAAAVGVGDERVRSHFSDTATSGDSGSVSASRMTWMAGNSILGAGEEATKRWLDGDRPAVGEFRFTPPPTETIDPETGVGQPNFSYGYVAEAVDLSVDIDTGHIQIDRVVCADDVGRAINPDLVVGQMEGAIVQAMGYTLSERLVVEDGRVRNPRLSTYLIPGIGDIPGVIEPVIVEHPDPLGPWGARGMGEMPFIPLAPAITAALHDATGIWFDSFPLTPDKVVAALRAHGIGGLDQ
jgi:CO/xanthine dehydrogenase Mo-binding subunit